MGLRKRFVTVLSISGLLAMLIISGASYYLTVKNAKDEARRKVELLFYYQKACLDYFRNVQLPLVTELVEKDRFYPELMSDFAASRFIHEKFKKYMPGFKVKYATLNPLNPVNKADEQEVHIIEELSKKGGESAIEEGMLNGPQQKYYFWAQAIGVEEGCLRCHGKPVDAPKDQVMTYGTEHGYGWKEGEIIGAFIAYLPMDEILKNAWIMGLKIFCVGIVMLLVLIFFIGVFLNASIVKPILELSRRAEEISIGDNLDVKVTYPKEDEIGALAKAINRLRISVVKMQKMLS